MTLLYFSTFWGHVTIITLECNKCLIFLHSNEVIPDVTAIIEHSSKEKYENGGLSLKLYNVQNYFCFFIFQIV